MMLEKEPETNAPEINKKKQLREKEREKGRQGKYNSHRLPAIYIRTIQCIFVVVVVVLRTYVFLAIYYYHPSSLLFWCGAFQQFDNGSLSLVAHTNFQCICYIVPFSIPFIYLFYACVLFFFLLSSKQFYDFLCQTKYKRTFFPFFLMPQFS